MKNIIISEGQSKVSKIMCDHLINKGYNVILLSNIGSIEDSSYDISNNQGKYEKRVINMSDEDSVNSFCEDIKNSYGSIDMLINGISDLDEEKLMEENSVEFSQYVRDKLKEIFLLTKAVSNIMIIKKKGTILYPMFYDALTFAGYSVSTVMNQAKISMMKCLAKELNAFKICVNAITFGYYNCDFDKEKNKEVKKYVEIFALKPKIYKIEEYIAAIEIFLQESSYMISGQNIHVGAGIETVL